MTERYTQILVYQGADLVDASVAVHSSPAVRILYRLATLLVRKDQADRIEVIPHPGDPLYDAETGQ